MLILSIDSAGSGCSACVWRDGTVLAQAHEHMDRGQDQRLMPLVLDVMRIAGVDFAQLDRIAVTRGPGSFTGLRIGLAAARGMGLASDKPVIGIDRFSIYREQFKDAENLLVVIQSHRAELFCKFYPAGGDTHEATMMTREQIETFLRENKNTHIVGDADNRPDFDEVTICALLASRAGVNDPAYLPRPLYLRAPDVTFPAGNLTIRSTFLQDAELFTSLLAQETNDEIHWWAKDRRIESSLEAPTTQGWCAYQDNQAVGFILCQTTQTQWDILLLYVKPEMRRKRIGEKLIQPSIDAMRTARGSLHLEVAHDNDAAIRLYEKLGFEEMRRRPGYYSRFRSRADAIDYRLSFASA